MYVLVHIPHLLNNIPPMPLNHSENTLQSSSSINSASHRLSLSSDEKPPPSISDVQDIHDPLSDREASISRKVCDGLSIGTPVSSDLF